jgi:hypothetical protein
MKQFDNMTSSSPASKYVSSKLSKLDLYCALFTHILSTNTNIDIHFAKLYFGNSCGKVL